MELTPTIDQTALDGLPEPIKECYIQDGDVFKLNVPKQVVGNEVLELVNTAGLRSALETERATAKTAQDKLKAKETQFEGIDPVAARDALAKVSEIDGWDPDQKLAEHKAQFEKQVKQDAAAQLDQATQKFEAKVKELQIQLDTRANQLRQAMIMSEGASAIAELKGNPTLLMPIIERMTDLIEHDDGTLEAIVLNESGTARISPDTSRQGNMTIKELVAELRELPDYRAAFAGTDKSGGGISGSTGGDSPKTNPWKKDSYNLTEQMRIKKSNPALAAQLQAEA